MHKSQLAGFIIDCKTDSLDAAAEFWSAALGMQQESMPGAEGEKYVALKDATNDLVIEVQSVSHPSRVHLDIETDNIEAEVRRLEELGARRLEAVGTWCVMEAPTGQRFCVVRNRNAGFAGNANVWQPARE